MSHPMRTLGKWSVRAYFALLAVASLVLLFGPKPAKSGEGDFSLLYKPNAQMERQAAVPDPITRRVTLAKASPFVVRIVDQTAKQYGVPVEYARFHVARESSFNPAAKNPGSTAKGTLQVIKGSHEAITGRSMTLAEHLASAGDPYHGTSVGMAHLAAAYEARPTWSPQHLWRSCHVGGLRNCGTSLQRAAQLYRGDRVAPRSGVFEPLLALMEVRG